MGIFDSNSEEEVKISPNDEEDSQGRLKDEVETEIVGESKKEKSENTSSKGSSDRSSRGERMRKRSNKKGKSTFGDDGVSLKDIHRQNERIIELMEELNSEDSNTEKQEMEGDLNGVL